MLQRDTIVIEGLRVEALIGVYPHEREQPQPLLIDVQMERAFNAAADSDALLDTIDYADVVALLRGFVSARADQLLERLAQQCSDLLLARYQPASLRLQIRKPIAADALGCASVGVCVERRA